MNIIDRSIADSIDRAVYRLEDKCILSIIGYSNYVFISRKIHVEVDSHNVANRIYETIEVEINEDWDW